MYYTSFQFYAGIRGMEMSSNTRPQQHHTATGCGAGDPQCAHISILRAPGSDPEDRPKALLSITLLLTPAVTGCRAPIPAGGKVPAGYGHRHLQHCCTVLQQHPAQRHAAGRVLWGVGTAPHWTVLFAHLSNAFFLCSAGYREHRTPYIEICRLAQTANSWTPS